MEATEQPSAPPRDAGQQGSWSSQSIFSALKRTPELHPAADAASRPATHGPPAPEAPHRETTAPAHHAASGHEPAASSTRDRVALTLRVDQERHTRLRVLAAQTKRSSQDILLAALDCYIDSASQGMSFCECLKPSSMCCKSSQSGTPT